VTSAEEKVRPDASRAYLSGERDGDDNARVSYSSSEIIIRGDVPDTQAGSASDESSRLFQDTNAGYSLEFVLPHPGEKPRAASLRETSVEKKPAFDRTLKELAEENRRLQELLRKKEEQLKFASVAQDLSQPVEDAYKGKTDKTHKGREDGRLSRARLANATSGWRGKDKATVPGGSGSDGHVARDGADHERQGNVNCLHCRPAAVREGCDGSEQVYFCLLSASLHTLV